VPEDFRFSAKLPKTITHKQRLIDAEALLESFLSEINGLGAKLAVILVQLPPSLAFDPRDCRLILRQPPRADECGASLRAPSCQLV
jgi:uncharacterized protein YecE (DUF72 family)